MYKGFWGKIKKPIFALAPLADVTDPALRSLVARYSKPDVIWTEFVSADGLFLGGYDALLPDLNYTEVERPIIAQFFTSKPAMMEKASRLALDLGFDGVDINMGCPDKSVEKQCAGASLIKNHNLAAELISSAKKGASSISKQIPVSVKTRIGYNTDEIDSWITMLLQQDIPALTVHLRTRKEMSEVPAHWDKLAKVVGIRDSINKETLIIGNGDVLSLADGMEKINLTGADGVMLGRAIFGNPWLFENKDKIRIGEKIPNCDKNKDEKLMALRDLLLSFETMVGNRKNFSVMKKHFKSYISGWDNAKDIRLKLMQTSSYSEATEIINNSLN